MTNEELERISETIREVYCQERRAWHMRNEGRETDWGLRPMPRYDGGQDHTGRTFQRVWTKVARFVISAKMDPARFVKAQFAARSAHPVDPNQLVGDMSLVLYEEYRRKSGVDLENVLKGQMKQFEVEVVKLTPCKSRGWTDDQIVRCVLGNGLLQLSSLFRLCISWKKGYDDLTQALFEPSALQYLPDAAEYDRGWGSMIPADFKSAAHRFGTVGR